jgi:hypothetical protein
MPRPLSRTDMDFEMVVNRRVDKSQQVLLSLLKVDLEALASWRGIEIDIHAIEKVVVGGRGPSPFCSVVLLVHSLVVPFIHRNSSNVFVPIRARRAPDDDRSEDSIPVLG